MFDRFTLQATKAVMLALEEARRLGWDYVAPEMMLLGLIGEGTGGAAKALKRQGINLKLARTRLEEMIGRGSQKIGAEVPFSPEGKRMLEASWHEGRRLGLTSIDTEVLLLGLLKLEQGVAIELLKKLDADLAKLQSELLEAAAGSATEAAVPSASECAMDFPDLPVKIMHLAQEEAFRLRHDRIGTEDLMLSLVGDWSGIAAQALKSFGVDSERARAAVRSVSPRCANIIPVPTPFSLRVKRIIEQASEEAKQLGDTRIESVHLLLALITDREAVGVIALESMGIDLEDLRKKALELRK